MFRLAIVACDLAQDKTKDDGTRCKRASEWANKWEKKAHDDRVAELT